MEALDGNAIGGPLMETFGREMTTEPGACRHCGTVTKVAELRVYLRAPGSVARCPHCGDIVMVIVEVRGATVVHSGDFEL
jgi:Family of unknown function (DUF6510)